jgi:hypothetical protein
MRRFRLPTRVQAFLSVFGWTTACRNAEHKSDRRHWSVRGNVKVFARLAFTVSGVTVIGKTGSASSPLCALSMQSCVFLKERNLIPIVTHNQL